MWHDNETSEDLIGFSRFADTIVSLVREPDVLPVTIGLFGDWGSGKSSVLRMVESRLVDDNESLVIRFDGWLFEGYDDAKAALMSSILDVVSQNAPEEQRSTIIRLAKRIDWFRAAGLAAKGVLSIAAPATALGLAASIGGDLVDAAKGVKDVIQDAPDEPTISPSPQAIRDFRRDFKSLVDGASFARLVVLIDDLDRCVPESIISTLEAIKLFLSVDKTAFVIAADEEIVKDAVARRYPREAFTERDLATEYLDKLVQVPIPIPRMDLTDTETFIYLLFCHRYLDSQRMQKLLQVVNERRRDESVRIPLDYGTLTEAVGTCVETEDAFALGGLISPVLARNCAGNPRLVKRFLNAFELRCMLARTEDVHLQRNVLAKLMILERWHGPAFQQLYRWQSEEDGLAAQLAQLEEIAEGGKSDSLPEGAEAWATEPALLKWLKMPPKLGEVNLSRYFSLARDSLKVDTATGRRLTRELQEALAQLIGRSDGNRRAAAKKLVGRGFEELSPLCDALRERVHSNSKNTLVVRGWLELCYGHGDVAADFLTRSSELPVSLWSGNLIPQVAKIAQRQPGHAQEVCSLLKKLSDSNTKTVATAALSSLTALRKKS